MILWELLIVLLLIFLNGLFAMSELAVVSARRARLQVLAEQGSKGAVAALKLTEHPGRFLSTVQIGITLIGIFAGAYGG
ncbi:MAG TPA: CNNM domain-containing protein, partial [Plasticicumulans sp.]|nr:CNNM domain-containing protein [Plasticicumulans sp.]